MWESSARPRKKFTIVKHGSPTAPLKPGTPSDTWVCPYCGEVRQKFAGGVLSSRLDQTIGLRGTFQCPTCGRSVDIAKIYDGTYDTGERGSLIANDRDAAPVWLRAVAIVACCLLGTSLLFGWGKAPDWLDLGLLRVDWLRQTWGCALSPSLWWVTSLVGTLLASVMTLTLLFGQKGRKTSNALSLICIVCTILLVLRMIAIISQPINGRFIPLQLWSVHFTPDGNWAFQIGFLLAVAGFLALAFVSKALVSVSHSERSLRASLGIIIMCIAWSSLVITLYRGRVMYGQDAFCVITAVDSSDPAKVVLNGTVAIKHSQMTTELPGAVFVVGVPSVRIDDKEFTTRQIIVLDKHGRHVLASPGMRITIPESISILGYQYNPGTFRVPSDSRMPLRDGDQFRHPDGDRIGKEHQYPATAQPPGALSRLVTAELDRMIGGNRLKAHFVMPKAGYIEMVTAELTHGELVQTVTDNVPTYFDETMTVQGMTFEKGAVVVKTNGWWSVAKESAAGLVHQAETRPGAATALAPQGAFDLGGNNEVRVRNPNVFSVQAEIRSGAKRKTIDVPPNGVGSVFISNGKYDIYFVYSDKPDALFQGDSFTLNDNGVEIQIVKAVNGNYGIRQVK